MTSLGVYDVAGNVREWCYNEADEGARATRGGAWTDAPYHVGWIIPKPALDRDATNGFRLVRVEESEASLAALRRTVTIPVARDFRTEQPASDAEFAVFRRLYDYTPRPLNAVIERADTAEHWVREVVTYDLASGERGGAVLFVPNAHRRPLQSLVYWSGGYLLQMGSVDEEILRYFDFIVRSGRVVAIPILAGGYGREDPRPGSARGFEGPIGPEDHAYRDLSILWVKDFRRVLDYLETRPDVDPRSMGYYGFSFGGRTAPQVLAVEPRLRAAVLNVGGLSPWAFLPEVDPFNFVPRVLSPVLMINGEYDIVFPYETSQRPMFERLGTPAEDKRLYITPAAHLVPLDELITQTLHWFDQYLGVPAGI
jgi:dienelactone hydrolase